MGKTPLTPLDQRISGVVSGLLFCVGVGVGVGVGVADTLGVGVGATPIVGVGDGAELAFGVGEIVGTGATFLYSFHTNFLPDFTHRNSLPDWITLLPNGEQLAPAFTAPCAGSIETTVEAMSIADTNREIRKKELALRGTES